MNKIDASSLTLSETVVKVGRVAKVVKGGKRFSFNALVVVGDGSGHVGVGLGKAKEVQSAIRKAVARATKEVVRVPLMGATIPLPEPALDVRRRVIELSEYPLEVESQRIDALLDGFIVDAQDRPRELAWALSRRAERLFDEGHWPQAHELLEAHAGRFRDTPFEAEFDFLTALPLWGAKRYDDAELMLRELLNRVTPSDPVYPKAGWLLGKVVLFDGQVQRPEEAVAIFREVIASRADRYYMPASWVGIDRKGVG